MNHQRDYPRLDYYQFSNYLLDSYDLDPIYYILVRSNMSNKQTARWLLAYWCYYHAGVASYLSEIADPIAYYERMYKGVKSFPRGTERRHFRGDSAYKAVRYLSNYGPPEAVVNYMVSSNNFMELSYKVQEFVMFGPWIAWKIADMAERVLDVNVDFSNANLAMYRDPVQGAALVRYNDWQHPIDASEVAKVVELTLFKLGDRLAPPSDDRLINIQEVETFLCKWKSHIKGSYPLYKDMTEIKEGLHDWGDTAQELLTYIGELTKGIPNE